ncbi:hypothetical protein SGLAM104S_01985 [Streptomyces glaucescens]
MEKVEAATARPASPLTERQEARRRRILRASAQLAGRGGFDAVQMREVAESSQVALGTLYRYFPSKIHLLVATMQDQLEHMHGTLRKRPPAGETPGERVAETLMRAFRALQREPHLADAMVRALTFADRSVSPEVDQVSRQTTAIILDAMGREHPTPAQLSAVRVIEHTWHSALITWLSGRASIAQVKVDIETVCRLIDLTDPETPHDAPRLAGLPGALRPPRPGGHGGAPRPSRPRRHPRRRRLPGPPGRHDPPGLPRRHRRTGPRLAPPRHGHLPPRPGRRPRPGWARGRREFPILPPDSKATDPAWVPVRDTNPGNLPSRIAEATGSPEFITVSLDEHRLCAVSEEEYDYWVVRHTFGSGAPVAEV